jgi:hypothetical protein
MDDALLANEVLHGEEALLLVVAHAAAMRAVGAETEGCVMQRTTDAADVASASDAAALLRSLRASLAGAKAAGDAARGRARVACVCRAARAAADVATTSLPHVVAHARAHACTAIYARLAPDVAALCGGAPALARLCVAAVPPPEPFFARRSAGGSAGSASDDGAAGVAAAWRALARDVAAAAPEAERPCATLEERRAAINEWVGLLARLLLGKLPNSRAKQLGLIGATQAEVDAGEALCA